MKFTPLAASLLALSFAAGPALAESPAPTAKPLAVAQNDDVDQMVQQFLADVRPASELSQPELQERMRTARKLLQNPAVKGADRQKIQNISTAAREELMTKRSAESNKGAGQQDMSGAAEQGTETTQGSKVKKGAEANQGNGAEPGAEAGQGGQPKPGAKIKKAEQGNGAAQGGESQQGLQPKQDNTAAQGTETPQDTQAQGAAAGQAVQAGQGAATAGGLPAILRDNRPLSTLSADELQQRLTALRQARMQPGLTPALRRQVNQAAQAVNQELKLRRQQPAQAGTPGTNGAAGASSTNGMGGMSGMAGQPGVGGQATVPVNPAVGNPDSENRARQIISDTRDARQMPLNDLRQRMASVRDLLQTNTVSAPTSRQLRQKLAADRDVLRGRMAASDNGQGGMGSMPGQPGAGGQSGAGGQPGMAGNGQPVRPDGVHKYDGNANFNINIVLGDRRPPQQLNEWELQQRIDTYRDAVLNQQYDAARRAEWQRMMAADRAYMRQMLMDQRRQRIQDLQRERADNQININLGMAFNPNRPPPPRRVFADEVSEQQIVDVLAAPPRRAIDRRYTIQEVEQSPQLRDVLPRVDIDTIHFGFGEAFVREEEVAKLDKIATAIERILAVHPREVFIIEGHTDAVGSDQSNLVLSRKRAEAVRQALGDYYAIPPQNLQPVGYGERFLLIPTSDPEPENRRVSVVRATPLVGELPQ